MTIRGNKDSIRGLSFSGYATITGWGALLKYTEESGKEHGRLNGNCDNVSGVKKARDMTPTVQNLAP